MPPYYLQSPQEVRDIVFDWTDRLDDVGSPQDSIDTSQWSVDPDVGSPTPTLTGATIDGACTFAVFRDLTLGEIYKVTNTITTAQGRVHVRMATVRCDEK